MLPPLGRAVSSSLRSSPEPPSLEAQSYATVEVLAAAAADYTAGPGSAHVGTSPAWKRRQVELLGQQQQQQQQPARMQVQHHHKQKPAQQALDQTQAQKQALGVKLNGPVCTTRTSTNTTAGQLSPARPKSAPDASSSTGSTASPAALTSAAAGALGMAAPQRSRTTAAATGTAPAPAVTGAGSEASGAWAQLPTMPDVTLPARLMASAAVPNSLRAKLQSTANRLAPDSGTLMQAWVNSVLSNSHAPSMRPASDTAELAGAAAAAAALPGMAGLAKYGLAPAELAQAGLADPAIKRLYRGLYVYSTGLFDLLQDVLKCSPLRMEVLARAWQAFLAVSEAALHSSFKSDFLTLLASNEMAVEQLEAGQEQLGVAQAGHKELAHSVQWLADAHAEEQALRIALRDRLGGMELQLKRERAAHQQAAERFAEAVHARSQMQLQLEETQARMAALQECHSQLQQQHEAALQALGQARSCQQQVAAMMQDMAESVQQQRPLHSRQKQLQNAAAAAAAAAAGAAAGAAAAAAKPAPAAKDAAGSMPAPAPVPAAAAAAPGGVHTPAHAPASAVPEAAAGANSAGGAADELLQVARALQQRVDRMVADHVEARQQCDEAKAAMYHLHDDLRAARLQEDQLEQQLGWARSQLAAASEAGSVMDSELAWTREQLEIASQQLEAWHAGLEQRASELAQAMVQLQELQATSEQQQREIAELEAQRRRSAEELAAGQARFQEAVERGRRLYGMMRMHSRALALAMRSCWDLQAARRVLQRQLAERGAAAASLQEELRGQYGKVSDMQGKLEARDQLVRALQSRCDDAEAGSQRATKAAQDMREQLAHQAHELQQRSNELKAAQTQASLLDQRLSALQKSSAKAAKEAEAQLRAAQAEHSGVRARLQDTVERQQEEVAQLRDSGRNLAAQVRTSERAVAEMHNKMMEAQAAAQGEQAKLLGQLRNLDNELKLARLETDKSRCQLELAAADMERSRAERDAATRALGRSEYEAKRLAFELAQRDAALGALRDQVAAFGGQVQQLQAHRQRLAALPLEAAVAAAVAAPSTSRGGRDGDAGAAHASDTQGVASSKQEACGVGAAQQVVPGVAVTAQQQACSSSAGASSTAAAAPDAAAAAAEPGSPRLLVQLSPRSAAGTEGAPAPEGPGVMVPVELAQRLAAAALEAAAAAAAQLSALDEQIEGLQQEASGLMVALADKLARRPMPAAGNAKAGGRPGGADQDEASGEEGIMQLVKDARASIGGLRAQQRELLTSRAYLLEKQHEACKRAERIHASLRAMAISSSLAHEEGARQALAEGQAALTASITQQLAEAEAEFVGLQERIQELLALAGTSDAARQAAQQQCAQLQLSTEPLYERVHDLEAVTAKLQWEVDAANSRISDLQVDVGTLRADKETLQQALVANDKTQVVSQLQAKISQLQQELDTAHTTVADSLRQLHQQQEQQRVLLEARLDQERQRLRREIAELRQQAAANPREDAAGAGGEAGCSGGETSRGSLASGASSRPSSASSIGTAGAAVSRPATASRLSLSSLS